ncbi:MAG: hypothetical protein ACUVWJ_02835 [Spirochaetota bacterium]
MTIEELAKSEGIWSSEESCDVDIVLKSSVSFRRNLKGYLFSHKLGKKERESLNSLILTKIEGVEDCKGWSIYDLEKCSLIDKKIFFERNIIEDDSCNHGILVVSRDQNCYFILNNRDHVRLVTNGYGFHFESIYHLGKKIIAGVENNLRFEWNKEFGYLTANPLNCGSGIAFSITLHLAGLVGSGKINELLFDLEKRGLYLHSGWIDGYYEISNKKSAGIIEKELYNSIKENFKNIVHRERAEREDVYRLNKSLIEDRVWRSYGLLLSCRLLSLFEALDLLSHLRLGISLGIIDYIGIKEINLLLYYIQDYHLRKRYGVQEISSEMDGLRAQFIREYLKNI